MAGNQSGASTSSQPFTPVILIFIFIQVIIVGFGYSYLTHHFTKIETTQEIEKQLIEFETKQEWSDSGRKRRDTVSTDEVSFCFFQSFFLNSIGSRKF